MQHLCMSFTYRRWRWNINNNWESIDQDTRDGNHSCLIEIVLIRQGHPSLTLEVEENWTLEYVRKELEVAIQNPPDQFCFKLDGRKVSRRREHQIICRDVVAPHELEALEDI